MVLDPSGRLFSSTRIQAHEIQTPISQTSNLKPQPSHLNPQPSTLKPAPSALHPQPYTLHAPPYTLHPQPSTLNPIPQAHLGDRVLDLRGHLLLGLKGVVEVQGGEKAPHTVLDVSSDLPLGVVELEFGRGLGFRVYPQEAGAGGLDSTRVRGGSMDG